MGRWNLGGELAKVIDKGLDIGVLKRPGMVKRMNGSQDEQNNSRGVKWSLSKEVEKVIEVGVALGVNFNGNEDCAEAEIRRRESEDILRYRAQHG